MEDGGIILDQYFGGYIVYCLAGGSDNTGCGCYVGLVVLVFLLLLLLFQQCNRNASWSSFFAYIGSGGEGGTSRCTIGILRKKILVLSYSRLA